MAHIWTMHGGKYGSIRYRKHLATEIASLVRRPHPPDRSSKRHQRRVRIARRNQCRHRRDVSDSNRAGPATGERQRSVVSVAAITQAYATKAGSPSNKAVLLALANHANKKMQCWPSIATLARETELSDDTVSRCLASLAARRLITRTPRYTNGTRARTSDLYTLTTFPHDAATSPHGAPTSPHDAATSPRTVPGGSPHQGGDIEPSVNPKKEPTVSDAPAAPRTRQSARRRGTKAPLPDGWTASAVDRQAARCHGLDDEQIDFQEAEFREFWRTDGGAKASWSHAFRNRVAHQATIYGVGKLPRKLSTAPATPSTNYGLVAGTPQCDAWRDYYTRNPTPANKLMLSELTNFLLKGIPFPAPSEFPPDHQPLAA